MAALDQLQRRFAFAYAAAAGDQHAHAVYLQQHAVQRFARSQALAHVDDGVHEETGGYYVRLENRYVVLLGQGDQLLRRAHAAAQDDARDGIGKELAQPRHPNLGLQRFQIAHLRFADDLRTLHGEVFVVPGKLQAGTVQVGRFDRPFIFGGGAQRGKRQRLDKIINPDQASTSVSR